MQLIGSITSPFVRKIRIQLLEKKLPFEFREEIPWNADSIVPQYNPLGKVPVLVDDEGKYWHDSPVIAERIECIGSLNRLIPAEPMAAVGVRQLEALADGLCEAGVAIFLERKRTSDKQDPAWISRQQGKIQRTLTALEALVAETHADTSGHLHESGFSLADITFAATLEWMRFRMPEEVEALGERSKAYLAKVSDRPSFRETVPSEG